MIGPESVIKTLGVRQMAVFRSDRWLGPHMALVRIVGTDNAQLSSSGEVGGKVEVCGEDVGKFTQGRQVTILPMSCFWIVR